MKGDKAAAMTATVRTTRSSRSVQASWLALANLLSLSATLVLSAILSRFLSPAEYGTYRQVIYVYTTLLTLFSLGLPKAYSYFLARVPLEEGRDVVRKLTLLFTGLAALFSLALFAGARPIAALLGNPLLSDNLRYFAVTPLLLMPVLGVENILTTYGQARRVAGYVLCSRLLSVLCGSLPVLLFHAGVRGAVLGFVAASLLSSLAGLRLSFSPFRDRAPLPSQLSLREVFRFSMPVFASSLYGFVIGSASQFFVSRYLGVEEFALFANGYRELPLAGTVIGAVAGVLLPEFSRMARAGADTGQYVALWRSVLLRSSALIYPLSVFCCLFAPEIIELLYGDRYREAAVLFRIATAVNLARIVPYAPVMFALDRGREFARAHLATALLLVALDLLCVHLFPSLLGLTLIATGCTLLCLAMLAARVARILDTPVAALMPWRGMLRLLLAATAAGLAARLVLSLAGIAHPLTLLCTGLLLFASTYPPLAAAAGIDYLRLFGTLIPETQAGRSLQSALRLLQWSRFHKPTETDPR